MRKTSYKKFLASVCVAAATMSIAPATVLAQAVKDSRAKFY
jgi:hypothetical protein